MAHFKYICVCDNFKKELEEKVLVVLWNWMAGGFLGAARRAQRGQVDGGSGSGLGLLWVRQSPTWMARPKAMDRATELILRGGGGTGGGWSQVNWYSPR